MAYTPFCGHSDWFRSAQRTILILWCRFAGIGGATFYFSVPAGYELENTQSKPNAVEDNKANVQREADMRVKIREALFKPRSSYVWSQVLYFTAFYEGNTIFIGFFKDVGSRSFMCLKVLRHLIPLHLYANKYLNFIVIFEAIMNSDYPYFKINIKAHALF